MSNPIQRLAAALRPPPVLAKRIIHVAAGQESDDVPELTGRAIGGHARAASMAPEERSEVGRKATAVRWGER